MLRLELKLEFFFIHSRKINTIIMTVQDNRHFYLLSSSRKGGHSDWGYPASWNVKRISSSDPKAGSANYQVDPFNKALGGDISVPEYSEVLWVEPNKPNGIGNTQSI